MLSPCPSRFYFSSMLILKLLILSENIKEPYTDSYIL
nr:MAG TPA: hypothetical protein [Caudoviricetes sp.]